jgi:uronate dehydrogenase
MARVLVTGSAGAIGRPVCAELDAGGHEVRAFDLRATPGAKDAVVGDVADREAVRRATEGMDAVVHLAAIPTDAPFPALLGPNVLGVHHVLEAACEHGVRRVVLTSTVQTVGPESRVGLVKAERRAPGNHYALTKIFAEEMGAMAARKHGLSIIVPRVAWMVRDMGEAKRMIELGAYDVYLSPRDAARFFRIAVEAQGIDFAVMFVAGPESGQRFDLEPARRLGFEPRDRFPEGLDFHVERPRG